LSSNKQIIECNENYIKAWDEIAGEFQRFGADSIATWFRGNKGVLYKEILSDVCKKMKVNYNKKSQIERIEGNLLLKIIEDSLEKMTDEEKREFAKGMKINIVNLSTVAIMVALQGAINIGGFASYQLATIVANSFARVLIGRGLVLAANAAMMRGLAMFAGPIGLAISALLALPLITSPAYRGNNTMHHTSCIYATKKVIK
jgi:uncharacterized protein YaaW (UPF0174 family)